MGYFIAKGSPATIVKESDIMFSLDNPYTEITTTKDLFLHEDEMSASFAIDNYRFNRDGWVMHIKKDLITPEVAFFGARTFTVTGTIEGLSRFEVWQTIEKLGGKYNPTVSSKTDILIVGSKPGGTKIGAATRLGVHIMTEADFLKLIS